MAVEIAVLVTSSLRSLTKVTNQVIAISRALQEQAISPVNDGESTHNLHTWPHFSEP